MGWGNSMDAAKFFKEFQDHLAPRLDTYEQAIYLYLVRHSRLLGTEVVVIGFKSARKKMAFGVGEAERPMSEGTCSKKVSSLAQKQCIKIEGSEWSGTKVKVFLPAEIAGVIPVAAPDRPAPSLDEMDFYEVAENRLLILKREGGKCFYCQKNIGATNHVLEHVVSRPTGTNGFRNIVAACVQCNNRKKATAADDYLRILYREGLLSDEDLRGRISHLERLRNGELRPSVARE